jgi:hypothetical protein
MNNYRWLIPLIACATVIGIHWYRTNDGNMTICQIKKKYWYAGLEVVFFAAAIAMAFKTGQGG